VAHVQKRGDRKYRARYLDPDGRERSRTFNRKVDAERFLATVEADKLRGSYVDTSHGTTVTEYARTWAASRPHRPTTVARVEHMIRKHIEGTRLGSRRLVDVRPSEVQAWVADRAQALAPSTLRVLVSLLSSVFAAAVADRLIATSPIGRLSLPRTERERVIPLTVDEVRALADAMPHRFRAMVIAQAGLGLRVGELLALRLSDVDFLRRTVRIERQSFPDGSVGEPKTPRSRRTVPLPQVVGEALSEHIAAYPPVGDGSLFMNQKGRLYSRFHYNGVVLAAAARRAGLPANTTSHALRHHYASVLLAAGESVVAVAERLGHENATLVLTTYGHLMPDSEDRTRRAIDVAWTVDGPQTAFDHG
jgi:integrase